VSQKKGGFVASKIRVKLGHLEVECEGTEEFLRDELPRLLETFSKLEAPSVFSAPADNGAPHRANGSTPSVIQGTTAAIAAKLGSKTGAELVTAAAAHLTFVKQQESFTRKELVAEMKSASGYFKQTFVNNLSGALTVLTKSGTLFEATAGRFSLSAAKRTELGAKLA
jgi:hypothetical protein